MQRMCHLLPYKHSCMGLDEIETCLSPEAVQLRAGHMHGSLPYIFVFLFAQGILSTKFPTRRQKSYRTLGCS